MLTQFRNWGINTKIMSILLVSICIIAVAVETIMVPLMEEYFMNERQITTQHVVEVAYGILREQAGSVVSGQKSLNEAKKRAIGVIKSLRYSGDEYFWIHDMGQPVPRMIMNAAVPALDGAVLDDPTFNRASAKRALTDSAPTKLSNTNIFVTMNEVAETPQGGFVSYAWPKLKANGTVSEQLYPKVSFVKKFEPWGWVIGSGIYVDDVKAAVSHIRRLIHTASILFCLATITIYYLMGRYISQPVINLAAFAKRIVTGEYGAELPVTTNDEVGLLSESLNQMSHQVQEKSIDLELKNRELQKELAERRHAEKLLTESEEKFRTLVNNSFDVIFVLDSNGVFQFISPSWESHFGYPVSSVIGTSFQHFVHAEDAAHCFAYLSQVMSDGSAATCIPYRVRHSDGSYRLFIANGTRHTDPNGAPLYIGIGRDITDEKRLEEERFNLERQFLHAQKLESLGIMAGGIAHDFNNLLTVIIGNLELSAIHLDKGSPVATRIGYAMQASRRAADLTQHMLAYSGRGVFEIAQLDLNQLVLGNCDLFRTTIPKTISMETSLTEALPPIMGDAGQLQQVIMNLITNAAEAIGTSPGRIVITTGVEECGKKLLKMSKLDRKPPPGTFVTVEITDSGCGMDEETKLRIFEPFYTTKFTGRGLGMASVMGIVKSHEGAILVSSSLGAGSTFKVLLPAYTGKRNPAIAEFPDTPTLKQHMGMAGTVLVVEDEEQVRDVCRAILEGLRLQTLFAADGKEALEIFATRQDDISLVILDLIMPVMDGVATLRELRLLQSDVKVIVTSGHSTESCTQMFATDKPDDFIQKPFQIRDIQEKITALISARQ